MRFALLKTTALLLAGLQAMPALALEQARELDCADCGARTPGHRARELAVLDLKELTTASARLPASSAYDYAAVDRLRVQSRPLTDATINMPDNHPLIRAMYTDHVNFYKLRYLLPQKFRIADGKQFQGVLDDVMLRMADTPNGKKLVCAFAADGPEHVQNYFQVSAPAAAKIKQSCAGVKVPDAVRGRLRAMSYANPPMFPDPATPYKKFVFIFSESGRPGVEAYTSTRNVSYLVLNRETMNPDALLRTISHELAISYDQLSRTAYLMDPITWEQGIQEAFGNRFGDSTFEDLSRAQVQELKCAYRDPALKYAATAQRAFEFEDAVVNDRGEANRSPSVAAKGTCGQILARNSVLLQAMARAVSWETGVYEGHCGKLEKDPKKRLQQLLSRIQTLEKITLKDKKTGKAVRFCDVVLKPHLGPNQLDIYSGGPRPGMNGWESNYAPDYLEKARNGNELTKDEMQVLGNSLAFPDMDALYREEDRLEGRRR